MCMVKKQRSRQTAGQDGSSVLRPCSDVIERILWDPLLDVRCGFITSNSVPSWHIIERRGFIGRFRVNLFKSDSDFTFGYTDRFNGVTEAPCSAPNTNVKGKARLLIKVRSSVLGCVCLAHS